MELTTGLVTLLCPAYNTAHVIHRLLDSVLIQDYYAIHMIVIDDGSTDNCKEVVASYIPKFEKREYELEYIYQENQGQSKAIFEGLKLVKGEFLGWPDSDDFYCSPHAISTLVNALERAGTEYGMARCNANYVDEDNLKEISRTNIKNREPRTEFECCLFVNDFTFPPIGSLVRSEYLLKVSNGGDIFYSKNAGQNWQMYLPMFYCFKTCVVNDILCSILIRQASHSRGQYQGCSREILKFETYKQTILETLKRIPSISPNELQDYSIKILNKYFFETLHLAYDYKDKKEFKLIYNRWDTSIYGKKSFKYRLLYMLLQTNMTALIPMMIKLKHFITKRF